MINKYELLVWTTLIHNPIKPILSNKIKKTKCTEKEKTYKTKFEFASSFWLNWRKCFIDYTEAGACGSKNSFQLLKIL